MTKKFKFALMFGALLAGAALTSCSSDEPANPENQPAEERMLVKAPEIVAYTSGHIFGSNGARAEEVVDQVVAKYVSHNDVEINLSVNEAVPNGTTDEGEVFDKDYISSHFSLTVRTPRDIKVRIPVPVDYYCPVDDMVIVKNHLEGNFVYGDQEHSLEMLVGTNNVSVTVDYDAEGFTITTAGINEEVIEYLAENYKDGITFEIWNYFNEATTRQALQNMMNNSTVEFLGGDENIDYYVNAFNEFRNVDPETEEELSREPNPWDCTVSIVAEQAADFDAITPGSDEYLDGFHGYNGSNLNKVFRNKALTAETEE